MDTVNATTARKNIYSLIRDVAASHKPVHIIGKDSSAVLISKEDWDALQETLYLMSIPGMKESLLEAAQEPLDACAAPEDIGWDIK